MFQMKVSNVIAYLKNSLLQVSEYSHRPNGLIESNGLWVAVTLDMFDYTSGKTANRAVAHFIFCGDTTVFFALGKTGDPIPESKEFKNTSNHADCWFADGVKAELDRLFFDCAKEINSDKRPSDINQNCSFTFGGHKFVKVFMRRKRDDSGLFVLDHFRDMK